ncbi:hypothetical protein BDV95DRAFT_23824 [Massariosphaeria phaeospora]|uniref:HMG box domain-containing protein n=1 Tax=Massariosphaeria phaeospora TaxID=100035 RepID=A0A7C8IFQ3_9PLEO|nr:hypothetical protein BDV95DRAFT_23824 [Massariosphaeria phaeospora]
MLLPAAPASHLGAIEWPMSIPAHASMLGKAHDRLFEQREPYRKHDAIIPLSDLEVLKSGARLLDDKIAHVWTDLLDTLPEEARNEYAEAPSARQVKTAGNTHDVQPNTPPPMYTDKSIEGSSLLSKQPYLGNINQSTQPKLPKLLNNPFREAAPEAHQTVNESLSGDQEKNRKRDLDTTPGKSPARKKLKARNNGPPTPRPKKTVNMYMLWSTVERARLAKDYPGATSSGRSKQLSAIWHAMTPEEKAPWEALQHEDAERYAEQERTLKTGGNIDLNDDKELFEKLREKAEKIPRAKGVSDWVGPLDGTSAWMVPSVPTQMQNQEFSKGVASNTTTGESTKPKEAMYGANTLGLSRSQHLASPQAMKDHQSETAPSKHSESSMTAGDTEENATMTNPQAAVLPVQQVPQVSALHNRRLAGSRTKSSKKAPVVTRAPPVTLPSLSLIMNSPMTSTRPSSASLQGLLHGVKTIAEAEALLAWLKEQNTEARN